MERIKQFVLDFPEIYFLILVLLASYTPPFQFSPLIILGLLILIQLYTSSTAMGAVFTILFAFINLYMLLALFSEYFEFQENSPAAIKLISVGLSLFVMTNLFIWLMARKYFKPKLTQKIIYRWSKSRHINLKSKLSILY